MVLLETWVVETLDLALLVEITFFRLIFVAVGGKVELFCLI